jgi:hypothetical protein
MAGEAVRVWAGVDRQAREVTQGRVALTAGIGRHGVTRPGAIEALQGLAGMVWKAGISSERNGMAGLAWQGLLR